MSRRISKFGLIAATVGALVAGTAFASPVTIVLTSGAASASMSAPVGSDTTGFSSSNFNGWDIQYANATSGSPNANTYFGALDLGTLSATCVPYAGTGPTPTGWCGALTITASDTGFTTATTGFVMGGSNTQTAGMGTVEQSSWVNSTLIGSFLLTNTAHNEVVGGGMPSSNPYSLTLTAVLTPNCGDATSCNAGFSFDGSIRSVPEPGTLALFGAGLLGCALVISRRRARQS